MEEQPSVSVSDFISSHARIVNQMFLEAYQLGYNTGMRRGIDQTRAEFAKAEKALQEL